MTRTRYIIGCMTGTSLDGLDAALVRFDGNGLAMTAQFIGATTAPLGDLRDTLLAMAGGKPHAPLAFIKAARQLGEIHAAAVGQLIAQHLPNGESLHAVVAHGQTIWHQPDQHLSWQLFDPWPIVRQHRAAVCYDLRQADLIAQGQGAPITPLADWVLFRDNAHHRTIVNLGGIINVTHLPAGVGPEQVTGRDVAPCNLLLDGVVQQLFPDKRFDVDGHIAARGTPGPTVHDLMLRHPFFDTTRGKAKTDSHQSIGREIFDEAWLTSIVRQAGETLSPDDIVASATWAIALELGRLPEDDPATEPINQLILAGGGAKNPTLVQYIGQCVAGKADVLRVDKLGIACESREAIEFAILGALSQDGVSITLPQVTQSENAGTAGVWAYP